MPSLRQWKICAASALLTLLVFQAAGWLLAWETLVFEARQLAGSALERPGAPLKTVAISYDLYAGSLVGKKEIRLEGNLYDIKSREICSDSVRLVLFHDHYEERLLHVLTRVFASEKHPGKTPVFHQWLVQWLCMSFLPPEPPVLPVCQAGFDLSGFSFRFAIAQNLPERFFPPPKLL